MIKSIRLFALLLAIVFIVGSALPSRALDRDDYRCHRHIEKAERNLDKAVRRHGEHSMQAERRRHELEEARERCHHDRDHDRH